MTFKDFWMREKHVALNAQSRRFRIIKWLVILTIAALLYWWKGWIAVVSLTLFCVIAGTTLHFLLRWKTDGWTKSWGPYKRIPLESSKENS